MKYAFIILSFAALSLANCAETPPTASAAADTETPETETEFNAKAAWDEFESTFRLFYAYIEREDFDVEAAIAETKSRALETSSPKKFRQSLKPLIYSFTDPHLIVGPLQPEDYNVIPTSADLIAEYRDSAYFVADVRRGSPAFEAGLRPGDQVLSVAGTVIEERVSNIFDGLLPDLTAKQKSYGATLVLSGRRASPRMLRVVSNGEEHALTLPNAREFARDVSKRETVSINVDGETAIVTINNSLGNNATITDFDKIAKQAKGARTVVIDLRNTPSGGNTEVARSIIGHFISEPRAYQTHEVPSLEREFSVPRRFTEYALPREPDLSEAKLIVLGGYWTGSMGEGLVIGLDAAADAITICSNMGDLLGGLSNYRLPASEMVLDLGKERLFHVNGTPREDYVCDIPLKSADTDVEGNDTAMTEALAIAK